MKLYLQKYLLVGPVYPLVASASVLGSVSSGLPFEKHYPLLKIGVLLISTIS